MEEGGDADVEADDGLDFNPREALGLDDEGNSAPGSNDDEEGQKSEDSEGGAGGEDTGEDITTPWFEAGEFADKTDPEEKSAFKELDGK